MQTESTAISSSFDIYTAARELVAELAGSVERKKLSIPSVAGVQSFLLYVRAKGSVPAHKVAGPITVQSIVGVCRFAADGQSVELNPGMLVSVGAEVPHDLAAETDSVLLVTHALRG